jgi:hypothetical protein
MSPVHNEGTINKSKSTKIVIFFFNEMLLVGGKKDHVQIFNCQICLGFLRFQILYVFLSDPNISGLCKAQKAKYFKKVKEDFFLLKNKPGFEQVFTKLRARHID